MAPQKGTQTKRTLRGFSLLSCIAIVRAASPWHPSAAAAARAIVAQLTLDEKISFVHGDGLPIPYVGNIPALKRLSIPALSLEDGPQGVADDVSAVTAWPSAFTVAMGFDVSAQYAFGRAMAEEQHIKGANVHLAPACNLARVPWGGRTFEYLGADPFLASKLVAAEVAGIQSVPGMSACVKHLAANSQETDRQTMSSNVGERAMRELYLPAFAAAIDAGVGSVMCSYNRLNTTYACEHPFTLSWLAELGFEGFRVSDWYATHSVGAAAIAGLDMEMPAGFFFSSALAAAVAAGTVPLARLDDMVTRVLTTMIALGLLRDPPSPDRNIFANATSAAHNALAAQLAVVTLLKNDGMLPLNASTIRSIAVFGDEDTVAGGGSGGVNRPYVITPREGLLAVLATAGNFHANVSYLEGRDPMAAAAAAAAADVAIVVVATTSSEGSDRADLSLPAWQDTLVASCVAANPRTIVVVRCPGACTMPWALAVPSILFAGMGGQEAGTAIARVIMGVTNPSGKLPLSFPHSMNDTWLSPVGGGPVIPERFPGTDRGRGFTEVDYDEELFIDYRWYDAQTSVEPLWPFGHGLSFSTFTYSDLEINGTISPTSNATVSARVCASSGSPPGTEVVQLYISHPPAAGEPPQVLRGFQKVALSPGGCAGVSFGLSTADVQVWDVVAHGWRVVPGDYGVRVSASSRDVRLTGSVAVL